MDNETERLTHKKKKLTVKCKGGEINKKMVICKKTERGIKRETERDKEKEKREA